jgi:hypothetical protein
VEFKPALTGQFKLTNVQLKNFEIPSTVAHAGPCLEGPAEVVEIFSPVREHRLPGGK